MLDRVWFYRVADVDQFVRTGNWPAGMKYNGAGRHEAYQSAGDTPAPPFGPAVCVLRVSATEKSRGESTPEECGRPSGAGSAYEGGGGPLPTVPVRRKRTPTVPPPRPNSFDLAALRRKLGAE
jgi:hypothetical protein